MLLLLFISGWSYGQDGLSVNLDCETNCYDAIIIGGEAPYIVEWQVLQNNTAFVTLPGWPKELVNGNTGEEDLCDPEPGRYKITVKDALCGTVTDFLDRDECPIDLDYYLKLPNPSTGDGGAIQVLVSGGALPYTYSWSYSEAEKVIQGCGVPKGLEVQILDESKVKVSWTKYSDALKYRVQYKPTNGGSYKSFNTQGNVNEMTLSDLEPNISYQVRVRARCTQAWNAFSSFVKFTPTYVPEDAGQATGGQVLESTESLLTDLAPGTYCYTVTDANCCKKVKCIEIPCVFDTEIVVWPAECDSGTGGTISVFPTNPAPPISYTWSNGATSNTIFNLEPGTYSLTAIDGNGCYAIHEIAVGNEVDWIVEEHIQNSSLCGKTGSISLALSGQGKPYSYQWDTNNSISNNAYNLGVGTHCVTITDKNDCQFIGCYEVEALPPIQLYNYLSNLCEGQENVQMNLFIFGGIAPYTVYWSNGSLVEDPIGLPAGDNFVYVIDSEGCTAYKKITVPVYSLMTAEAELPEICFGEETGLIDLTVTGGQAPHTFSWGNGVTTEDNPSATIGENYVTIYDNNGCKINESFFIEGNPQLFFYPIVTHPCYQSSNGSISLTVLSGTPPYTFDWSNNESGAVVSDLAQGYYTVTFTDAAGCQLTQEIELVEEEPLIADFEIQSSCVGSNTGGITLIPESGFGPLTYEWSDGNTESTIFNQPPGQYCVTVTEQNPPSTTGCVYENCWLIPGIDGFDLRLGDKDNDSRCGVINTECDGKIDIVVTPSNGNYTYQWSNGKSSQDLSDLCEGNYTVTVTDESGCTKILTTNICCCEEEVWIDDGDDYDLITGNCYPEDASTWVNPEIKIDGEADSPNASISVTVSGGTESYVCTWTGPDNYESSNCGSITGLEIGEYCLVVDDGCKSKKRCFDIVNCDNVDIEIEGSVTRTCPGFEAGSISLTISGGNSPHQVKWDNGQSGTSITNLAQGTYCATVTDQAGCFSTKCFSVGNKNPQISDSFCQRASTCNGQTQVQQFQVLESLNCNILRQTCTLTGQVITTDLGFADAFLSGCTLIGVCRDGSTQVIEQGFQSPGPFTTTDPSCPFSIGCATDVCCFSSGCVAGPFTNTFCSSVVFDSNVSQCELPTCLARVFCGNTLVASGCVQSINCGLGIQDGTPPSIAEQLGLQTLYTTKKEIIELANTIYTNKKAKTDIEAKVNIGQDDIFSSKVFPNPFSDIFTVEITESEEMEVSLVLSDLVGKEITKLNRLISPGVNTIEIAQNGLSPGVYFIQIIKNNELIGSHKIVKQ